MTHEVRAAGSVERLIAVGAALSPIGDDAASSARALLAVPPDGVPRGGRSALNSDGTPLQLCLSSSDKGVRFRWIADPAWEVAGGGERLAHSRAALDALLDRSSARALATPLATLLDRLIPHADDAAYRRGFLWHAATIGEPGVAVYVEAAPLGESAWDAAATWLAETLPDPCDALAAVESLREVASLASVGIEGTSPSDARAKLYFRLRRAVPLASLGIELLASPAIAMLLASVVGPREMRFSGAVFGVGFSLATGALADAKLDLCAHCLPHDAAAWQRITRELGNALGLASLPAEIHAHTAAGDARVALLGAGVDIAGRPRMNLYLGAETRLAIEESPRSCARAGIDRAVAYLAAIRNDDGSWHDYRLPVGRATEWVTAFTGLALAEAGRNHAGAMAMARAAAERVAERRAYEAGWGYNGKTGPDSDSTGFALRLLRSCGLAPADEDEQWLLDHWRDGGGFATYDDPQWWGAAHPCVTAAAFPALARERQHALRTPLLAYISRNRRPDGTWPSYWWRTHHYSTWHHLRLLQELDIPDATPIDAGGATSAFELAYALGIEHLAGTRERRDAALARLLAMQQEDGAFPGAANLRVTDPDCERPWEVPRGALYVDERATITTASAILTLSEVAYANE